MTMSVTITNTDTRPVPNAVSVERDGRVLEVLNPGESTSPHLCLWEGSDIILKEVALKEIV